MKFRVFLQESLSTDESKEGVVVLQSGSTSSETIVKRKFDPRVLAFLRSSKTQTTSSSKTPHFEIEVRSLCDCIFQLVTYIQARTSIPSMVVMERLGFEFL